MDYLRSDQYTYLDPSCPMRTDVHPADDVVEIVFGEYRFGGDTLRLVVNDPTTLSRLTETVDEARHRLAEHLYAKAHPDAALSQLDGGAHALR
jgi:hypothetical protein